MKYIFTPRENGKKVKDGVRGHVVEIPDGATVHTNRPILDSLDGITDYVAPAPSLTPQQALAEAIKSGIDVTLGELMYRLKCADSDRAAFTSLVVLTDLAHRQFLAQSAEAGAAYLASPVTITDAHGAAHVLTVSQYHSLALAYGAAFNTLRTAATNPA